MLENLQGKLNCGRITSQTVPLLDSKKTKERIKELSAIPTSLRLSINPFPPNKENGADYW
jgi:hypothetical protein